MRAAQDEQGIAAKKRALSLKGLECYMEDRSFIRLRFMFKADANWKVFRDEPLFSQDQKTAGG